jgi:hypothetical protein
MLGQHLTEHSGVHFLVNFVAELCKPGIQVTLAIFRGLQDLSARHVLDEENRDLAVKDLNMLNRIRRLNFNVDKALTLISSNIRFLVCNRE